MFSLFALFLAASAAAATNPISVECSNLLKGRISGYSAPDFDPVISNSHRTFDADFYDTNPAYIQYHSAQDLADRINRLAAGKPHASDVHASLPDPLDLIGATITGYQYPDWDPILNGQPNNYSYDGDQSALYAEYAAAKSQVNRLQGLIERYKKLEAEREAARYQEWFDSLSPDARKQVLVEREQAKKNEAHAAVLHQLSVERFNPVSSPIWTNDKLQIVVMGKHLTPVTIDLYRIHPDYVDQLPNWLSVYAPHAQKSASVPALDSYIPGKFKSGEELYLPAAFVDSYLARASAESKLSTKPLASSWKEFPSVSLAEENPRDFVKMFESTYARRLTNFYSKSDDSPAPTELTERYLSVMRGTPKATRLPQRISPEMQMMVDSLDANTPR